MKEKLASAQLNFIFSGSLFSLFILYNIGYDHNKVTKNCFFVVTQQQMSSLDSKTIILYINHNEIAGNLTNLSDHLL
jgi:hypothetical protein